MATLLAPYNTAMQLGQGFNSFTQQLCVDHAVIPDPKTQDTQEKQEKGPVAQEVVYKTAIIDKVTDVTNAMNINAAFAITYDAFNATGKGDFINTSKVKESDVSFMISVKVVNQVIYDHALTKFDPIPELNGPNFADVYGDSFISGFQEGGEFTAVISVKAKDRQKVDSIKAKAAITFTKDKLDLKVEGDFEKTNTDFLQENETTVSVTWIGGGQDLKKPEEDWSFETMRAAALKFPYLVAKTPMRTHAMLTKYTSLRSFYSATSAAGLKNVIPSFEKAGVYIGVLQEAYLDYKTIAKNLQVLAYDVSAGVQALSEAPAAVAAKQKEEPKVVKADGENESDEDSVVAVPQAAERSPLRITEPYPAIIVGLESARQGVRMMLNRIVAEVDVVTRNPEFAVEEKRAIPYMSPFLFKELLPVGSPVDAKEAAANKIEAKAQDCDNLVANLTSLADRSGGTARF